MVALDECFSESRVSSVPFEKVLESLTLNLSVSTPLGQVKFRNVAQLFDYAFELGYTSGLRSVAIGDVAVSLDTDGKNVICRYKEDVDIGVQEPRILRVEKYQ